VCLFCAAAIVAPAQTFTNLFNFYRGDGASPNGGLVQGTDGNFYGTTRWNGPGAKYYGTVFRITPAGSLATLHAFTWTDGATPEAGLLLATDGSLYGTTSVGGATNPTNGTLFSITERGRFTTLDDFQLSESEFTQAPLIQAASGDFYGASAGFTDIDLGSIFRATLAGVVTVVHAFDGTDGANPNGLIQATDGNFYGTTETQGAGSGTIFKLASSGAFTTLYNFTGGADGNNPYTALVEASDGYLYGTTSSYDGDGYGTIFKISLGGTFTTLYNFTGGGDGRDPYGALIQATDGNFYGTTEHGGASSACYDGCGTVFRMTPAGALTTLHSFDATDGSSPYGALLQATDGNLYGTTLQGGPYGRHLAGTVFRLSVGLGPFVKTLPTSGSVGATIRILGTDLTGGTSVTFNGAPATFTVLQPSEIIATVPAGATTGKLQVLTPGGLLLSTSLSG
jgi:uncharacterized repeat protein (TIGR03803 family)